MKQLRALIKKLVLSPAAPASLLIAGNLFLYQPAFIYFGNNDFLRFSLLNYLYVLFPLFILFNIVLTLPCLGKQTLWRRAYVVILSAISISLWFATFFKGTEGVLDGKSFLLANKSQDILLNTLLILIAGVVSGMATWFYSKFVNLFLYIINIISLSLVFGASIFYNQTAEAYSESKNPVAEMSSFSKQKNVLIILLDTFQSDFFEEILHRDPSLKEKFSGFTFFREAISASPTTYLAMPTIHSGEIYTPGHLISDFYKTTLMHSFMQVYHRKGYRTFLLNPYLKKPKDISWGLQEKISNNKIALLSETAFIVDISFFRHMPHLFKNYFYNNGKWRLQNTITQDISRAEVSNLMLALLVKNINTDSPAPTLKFIHSFATHPPAVLDENGNRVESPWNRNSAIKQDIYSLRQVVKLLTAMKVNNIYDSTTILIFGDHGAALPPPGGASILYSGLPLFLIKPSHTKGTLNISNKLVGLIDIPKTLCAATNDCEFTLFPGENVFDNSTKARKFRFNYYEWSDLYFNGKDRSSFNEFVVSGSPHNPSSWKRVLPDNGVLNKNLLFGDNGLYNHCGFGWEKFEQNNHRWTSGSIAELYLPLPQKNLHFEFEVGTHPQNPAQKMDIFVNNNFIGEYYVYYDKENIISFDVHSKMLNQPITHLQFKFKQYNQPNGDSRYLAVDFRGNLKIIDSRT